MKSVCHIPLLLITVLLLFGQVYPAVAGDDYLLDIELRPAEQLLTGRARIALSALPDGDQVLMRLAPQADILSIELAGSPLDYSFAGSRLTISVPGPGDRQSGSLTIHYRARFADPLPENTVGMENPSFGVAATIGEMGAYLSAGTAWFPQLQEAPRSYRIRIEGPGGLYGVTSGRLVEHGEIEGRSYSLWETDYPQSGLALSAGYYRIFQQQADGIQVLAFLSGKNAELAQTYLDPTRKYLQFYQRLLGPYPFRKFAIVENFLPTGYGLPSWTLLGSNVIALPFIPHTSLPHEIVHSWFGNDVEVDYHTGNWAEGLTSYLSDYLLKEQRSAEQGRDYRLKLLRDYAALVGPEQDYPLSSFVSRTSKPDQAIGYGKAAMVFHMLRQELGEESFWSALRRIVEEGSGKRLGWNDLQRIFKDVAGRDLQDFFAQWVDRPGAVQMRFAGVEVEKLAAGWKVHGTVLQQPPYFSFRLPLRLKTEAGSVEQVLAVSGRETRFALQADAPPLELTGDPDAHLFRRLVSGELPATINDLRASRRLLVVAAAADDPLLQASADLLLGLQKRGARVISWQDVEAGHAAGFDLLFIGSPPAGLDAVGEEADLQVGRREFSWQGSGFRNAGDSLFYVGKNPLDGQRLIALFQPLSVSAARQVARKIPHYGRYSLLIFSDGTNQIKQTIETGESPLRVDLGQR